MTLYNITKDDEFEGASIILSDGTALPVASDHPRYAQVIAALIADADEAEITRLVNPAQAAYGALTRLSERVTRKGNTIFFDGDALNSALTKHIVRIMDEDIEDESKSWEAYVRFLEKVQTNPSDASKEHLFTFIDAHGITIHEDGDILLYKGVQSDGTSITSGYGIVDGKVYEKSYLPNKVGSVVEIPRSMVNENRGVACSTGLHGGTHSYANEFGRGGLLLTIKVNPRDVVSVPSDAQDQKVRVSRYEVLEETPARAAYTQTTYFAEESGFGDDEYEDDFELDLDDESDSEDDFDLDLIFEDEDEDEDDEPVVTLINFTPAARPAGSRVDEYKKLITQTLIPNGIKLGRFKGRNVTVGRREEFQQAMDELGLGD